MSDGLVFDIQQYTVQDGPGIRTTVFLKGCGLRCSWCCNPESQEHFAEIRYSKHLCRHCLRCQQACPERVTPVFDRSRCRSCEGHDCVEACPFGALQTAGRRMSASEVFDEVSADQAFYRNSGGGVTLSGGEPLLQKDFCRDLLGLCKAAGIHTAVETAGAFDEQSVLQFVPMVDWVYFDLKCVDPGLHRRLTGSGNERILRNFRRWCAEAPEKLHVRLAVIPGCNDSPEQARAMAAFLRSTGVSAVELLRFHPYAEGKYEELGRVYSFAGCSRARSDADDESGFRSFAAILSTYGISVGAEGN